MRVEVVGTVFTVERDKEAIEVRVARGSVLVRGARVPDGVQRLDAGAVLRVPPAPSEARASAPPAPVVAPDSRSAPAAEPVEPLEIDRVGALLRRADAARVAGRPERAASILGRIVRLHPEDERTPLAAFTLARIRLERLDDPRRAAADYARSLRLGLPASLAEAARAGRVVALGRAGDPRASAAAEAYVARHPGGRFLAEVAPWRAVR